MDTSQKMQPKEESLFKILNEISDIKAHCLACQQATFSDVKDYVTNTSTRTKLVLACSDHLNSVLSLVLYFNDPTRRKTNPASEDVIPEHHGDSKYHIHNFALRIGGRYVRILFATDNPRESLGDYNPFTGYNELIQLPLKQSSFDPEDVVERFSDLPLGANTDAQLSGSDQALALASGLAQMDIAFEAVEDAYSKLQLLGTDGVSSKVSCNILHRTIRVLNSAGAIARLVQDKGGPGAAASEKGEVAAAEMDEASGDITPKVCFEENNFVDGEAIPYVKERMKEVLTPAEQAHMGKTAEWLNTL